MALLLLCRAMLGRKVLPFVAAVDASGGEAGGFGGYGAVVAAKTEEEAREELRWAERRGAYQRLTPGKIEGALWKDTLAAAGLCEEEGSGEGGRALGFDRRSCSRCPAFEGPRMLLIHGGVPEVREELEKEGWHVDEEEGRCLDGEKGSRLEECLRGG